MNIVVILNNIRSNENVGSIFRTADAAGVCKILLCGYTPAPIDRFGRENKALIKVSLGAEKNIEWHKFSNLKKAVDYLKNQKNHPLGNGFSGFKIVGIEQSKKALDYRKIKKNNFKNIALIFGNEISGLLKKDLKLCNFVAQLPMFGKKESLNVSVCAGIVLYSLLDQ